MMYNKSGGIMAWQSITQNYKGEGTKRLKCIVYRVINFFLGTLLDALMCLLLNMSRSYPSCSVCTIPHQINVILQGKPTKNSLRKKSSFCHKLKFLIPICLRPVSEFNEFKPRLRSPKFQKPVSIER